jgi:hypothetical protein
VRHREKNFRIWLEKKVMQDRLKQVDINEAKARELEVKRLAAEAKRWVNEHSDSDSESESEEEEEGKGPSGPSA